MIHSCEQPSWFTSIPSETSTLSSNNIVLQLFLWLLINNRSIKVLLAKFPRLVFSHKWNVYSVFNFFYLFWLINYFFKSMIKITNFLTLYLSILRILRWKYLSFLICISFLKKSDSLYKKIDSSNNKSYRTFVFDFFPS